MGPSFREAIDTMRGQGDRSRAIDTVPRCRCFCFSTALAIVAMAVLPAWVSAQPGAQDSADTIETLNPQLVAERGLQRVSALAFSADARYLYSLGASEPRILVWDLATLTELRELDGTGLGYEAFALSPSGKVLAATDARGVVDIWNTADLTIRNTVRLSLDPTRIAARIESVAVSTDDRTLACGSSEQQCFLLDAETGISKPLPTGIGDLKALAFSHDGRYVAVSGRSGDNQSPIEIWEVAARKLHGVLPGHRREVSSLAFSKDDRQLFSGAFEGLVKVWNVDSMADAGALDTEKPAPPGKSAPMVRGIVVDPVDDCFYATYWGAGVQKWQPGHFGPVATQPQGALPAEAIAISPQGDLLALGDVVGTIELRNLRTGKVRTIPRGFDRAGRLAVSQDGHRLAVLIEKPTSRLLSLWDLDTCKPYPTVLAGRYDGAIQISSPDHWVAVADYATIHLFNPDEGRAVVADINHPAIIVNLRFSPASPELFCSDVRGTVSRYSVLAQPSPTSNRSVVVDEAGRAVPGGLLPLSVHPGDFSFDVHPDGAHAALCRPDAPPVIWDTRNGALRPLPGTNRPGGGLAYDPLGRWLATLENETLKIWDVAADYHPVRDIPTHSRPFTDKVFFSPDGKRVVTINPVDPIKVWDVESGKLLSTSRAGLMHRREGGFYKDGKKLFLTGEDLVNVLDTSTGEQLCSFNALDDDHWFVVTPDGRFDTDDIDNVKRFHWLFPDDPFRALPPEIFVRDYYEPQLLRRRLEGSALPTLRPLQALNRSRPIVEAMEVRASPHGRASSPGHRTVSVRVEVSAGKNTYLRGGRAVEMKSGAYDLRLFRDGQLVDQWPRLANGSALLPTGNSDEALAAWRAMTGVVKEDARKVIDFDQVQIPNRLPAGRAVEFSAYAFNCDRVKSATAKCEYLPSAAEQPSGDQPKAYLICIGINAYANPAWKLSFAADDARQMARCLSPRLRKAGYQTVETLLLAEETGEAQATKDEIHKILSDVATKATPDDLVLVSFSGHGCTDDDAGFYLIPAEAGRNVSPSAKPETALLQQSISDDELSAWMRGIDASEMVLIIDACHSAASVEQPWFKPGPMGNRGLGQLAYDKRMRILAASQADDVALESNHLRQGLLTYALTHDGLEMGGAARNGRITLGGWLDYGAAQVPKLHEEIFRSIATGGSRGLDGADGSVPTVLVQKPRVDRSPGEEQPRDFVPLTPTNLPGSSLSKSHVFQTPVLFDYSHQKDGLILQLM